MSKFKKRLLSYEEKKMDVDVVDLVDDDVMDVVNLENVDKDKDKNKDKDMDVDMDKDKDKDKDMDVDMEGDKHPKENEQPSTSCDFQVTQDEDYIEVDVDDGHVGPDSTRLKISEFLAGKIESLQMTNFMCHSNLELKFNSRINFITGKNGSGKSAIIAALVVALGGNASLTGRATGVVDFIKKGETWARVNLVLVNEGINAYKKNVYGKRITISRSLSMSSSTSYVVKSEQGVVVSRKKEEVDNIVVAFNLQIKNPICVLNQDVARNFLCTTDNSTRFTLFAKATQLDNLRTMYVKTLEMLVAARNQLKSKTKGIQASYREISQIKERLIIFASLEKHVQMRTKLENEYVWALVIDEENQLKKLINERNDLLKKKEEILEGEANLKRALNELENEIKELGEYVAEVKTTKSEKEAQKAELQQQSQDLEKEIEKAVTMMKHLTAKVDRHLADINGVNEHLGENDTEVDQNQAERKQAAERIKKGEGELAEVRSFLAQTQARYKAAQEKRLRLTRNVENLTSEIAELEHNKKELEVRLTGVKAKRQNNLLRFGPYTLELLAAIEDAAKKNYFYKKPIGPCGAYVNLTGDMNWAKAVESVISTLMTSYCVDNQTDFQTLTHIMEKICVGKQPMVIISKFSRGRHNIESGRVRVRGLYTVFDMLTFDNDVVHNTFIDQARIETIVLFQSDTQAASMMTEVKNVPKNARMGLTVNGDQYFPAPTYRTYYGDRRKPSKYFEKGVQTTESINKLEKELKEADASIQGKNKDLVEAKQDYLDSAEILQNFEIKIRNLKQIETKVQVELNHLKDIEESRPVTVTRQALEDELQLLLDAYEESKRKVSECQEMMDTLNMKKAELAMMMETLEKEEEGMEAKINELEPKLEEKKLKMTEMYEMNQGSNKEIENVEEKLVKIEADIKNSESALEMKKQAARDICLEKVDTNRAPMEVQKFLDKCERYLKVAESVGGTKEDIIQEYKTKTEVYNSMKKTERILERTIEVLTKAALRKEQRLVILQSHTASLVSFYFQATLQTRGYDGELKVDFEGRDLEMEVIPKDSSIARKDSKTLSGGERSYSMVAFILSIWKVVQMPIYFLDEFDVFMDKVNRKVIMELLLEHANVHDSKQFVFITPQDLSNIKPSDAISIFNLPDPERKRLRES